jgi:hypothetical protein
MRVRQNSVLCACCHLRRQAHPFCRMQVCPGAYVPGKVSPRDQLGAGTRLASLAPHCLAVRFSTHSFSHDCLPGYTVFCLIVSHNGYDQSVIWTLCSSLTHIQGTPCAHLAGRGRALAKGEVARGHLAVHLHPTLG